MAGHAGRTLPLILAEPCVSSPVSQKGRTSSSPYTSPGRIGGSVILVSRSVLVVAVKPSLLTYLLKLEQGRAGQPMSGGPGGHSLLPWNWGGWAGEGHEHAARMTGE